MLPGTGWAKLVTRCGAIRYIEVGSSRRLSILVPMRPLSSYTATEVSLLDSAIGIADSRRFDFRGGYTTDGTPVFEEAG